MMTRVVQYSLIKLWTSLVLLTLVSCENARFNTSPLKSPPDESLSNSQDIQGLANDNLANLARENLRNNEKPPRQLITADNRAFIDVDQTAGNKQTRVNEVAPFLKSHTRSSNYFEKIKRAKSQETVADTHAMKVKHDSETDKNDTKTHEVSRSDRPTFWYEHICKKLEYSNPNKNIRQRKKRASSKDNKCNSKCETLQGNSNTNNNNKHTEHSIHKRSVDGIIDEIVPSGDFSQKKNATPFIEIKIAATLPAEDKWLFSIKKVRPAIEIALEKMNPVIAHHNAVITARFRDSKCVIADGINEAINFYVNNDIDVMFGPCCDYTLAPCARQAVYWDFPIISTGGLASDFGLGKPTEFRTLTRLGSNNNALVEFFKKILDKFNWGKLNMVYDPNGQMDIIKMYCHIATNDLHTGIRTTNYSFNYVKFDHPDYIPPKFAESFGIHIAGLALIIVSGHGHAIYSYVTLATISGRYY